jgi:p-cumate 2,3-dioxygenase ferredoxin component
MSNTVRRVRLCSADDVEPGGAMQVVPEGLPPVAVFRVGDAFYCTQDKCTHAGASLGDEGSLEGYVVECAWHEGRFDVRTGAVCARPPEQALQTYAVVVEDGAVFIDVATATPE